MPKAKAKSGFEIEKPPAAFTSAVWQHFGNIAFTNSDGVRSTDRTRVVCRMCRMSEIVGLLVRSSVLVISNYDLRLGNRVRVLVRLVFTSRGLKMKTAARVGTRMYEFMRSNKS